MAQQRALEQARIREQYIIDHPNSEMAQYLQNQGFVQSTRPNVINYNNTARSNQQFLDTPYSPTNQAKAEEETIEHDKSSNQFIVPIKPQPKII